MVLTKHEGQTFQNQTIYISGQAFMQCRFIGCTLVLRETVYYLDGCTFERCNWHVDLMLLWGSPESLRELKGLIGLIEQGQSQLQPVAPGDATPMPAPTISTTASGATSRAPDGQGRAPDGQARATVGGNGKR